SGEASAALGAYHYADLRLAYTLRPAGDSRIGALRFTLLVRNITDQLYFSNGWGYRYRFAGAETFDQGLYPQAGRNILLGLGIDL
ncbi:MAG: TonB-dependent receptor, partial [Bacteroidota bacterium]